MNKRIRLKKFTGELCPSDSRWVLTYEISDRERAWCWLKFEDIFVQKANLSIICLRITRLCSYDHSSISHVQIFWCRRWAYPSGRVWLFHHACMHLANHGLYNSRIDAIGNELCMERVIALHMRDEGSEERIEKPTHSLAVVGLLVIQLCVLFFFFSFPRELRCVRWIWSKQDLFV